MALTSRGLTISLSTTWLPICPILLPLSAAFTSPQSKRLWCRHSRQQEKLAANARSKSVKLLLAPKADPNLLNTEGRTSPIKLASTTRLYLAGRWWIVQPLSGRRRRRCYSMLVATQPWKTSVGIWRFTTDTAISRGDWGEWRIAAKWAREREGRGSLFHTHSSTTSQN